MNLTGQKPHDKGQKPQKSAPMRNAARNADCQLCIPGVCCHDPARTVGCHLRFFGIAGMSGKPDDVYMVDACTACHRVLDNRALWPQYGLTFELILCAFMMTIKHRRAAGLILLPGD